MRDLLEWRADFGATVRADIEKRWTSEYVEGMIDGSRKAGVDFSRAA